MASTVTLTLITILINMLTLMEKYLSRHLLLQEQELAFPIPLVEKQLFQGRELPQEEQKGHIMQLLEHLANPVIKLRAQDKMMVEKIQRKAEIQELTLQ